MRETHGSVLLKMASCNPVSAKTRYSFHFSSLFESYRLKARLKVFSMFSSVPSFWKNKNLLKTLGKIGSYEKGVENKYFSLTGSLSLGFYMWISTVFFRAGSNEIQRCFVT